MGIIKRGKVERGVLGSWWLVDGKGNSITRLSGDWVEKYAGQELGIVVLNERTIPWFEFMAKILNGVDNYVLTPKGGELVSDWFRGRKNIMHREKAESMRNQAKTLLILANKLDPPYPCNGCNVAWGVIPEEHRSCREACSRLREWDAKQKEEEPKVALSDPLHDYELPERE